MLFGGHLLQIQEVYRDHGDAAGSKLMGDTLVCLRYISAIGPPEKNHADPTRVALKLPERFPAQLQHALTQLLLDGTSLDEGAGYPGLGDTQLLGHRHELLQLRLGIGSQVEHWCKHFGAVL